VISSAHWKRHVNESIQRARTTSPWDIVLITVLLGGFVEVIVIADLNHVPLIMSSGHSSDHATSMLPRSFVKALAADSWWLAATIVILAMIAIRWSRPPVPQFLSRTQHQLMDLSVATLADLAVLLAGRSRPALRDEWRAHVAGESGHDLVTWRKVRQALGFVVAAIQFRLADAADVAWRPADAVLSSRTLSNLFVWGPVIVTLFAIVHHDGRFGLVADVQDPVALGAFLYGVIRTGRWWRGIKPPEPKARRARE